MDHDLSRAIELLESGHYTCVLCHGDAVITDHRRGVRPLLQWLDDGPSLQQFYAADKVVGKAAAMLYCLLGVRALYAGVLSRPAQQVLRSHGIEVSCGILVDAIRNRSGTGLCPMEQAVWSLDDPADAPEAIRRALQAL